MTQKEWIKLTNGEIDGLLSKESPLVRLLGEKTIPYKLMYWMKRLILTFQQHPGIKAYFETKNETLNELFAKYSEKVEGSDKSVVSPSNLQAYNEEFSSKMKDIFIEETEFAGLHKIIVNIDEMPSSIMTANDMIVLDKIMEFTGKDIDEEPNGSNSEKVISLDDKRKEKE